MTMHMHVLSSDGIGLFYDHPQVIAGLKHGASPICHVVELHQSRLRSIPLAPLAKGSNALLGKHIRRLRTLMSLQRPAIPTIGPGGVLCCTAWGAI